MMALACKINSAPLFVTLAILHLHLRKLFGIVKEFQKIVFFFAIAPLAGFHNLYVVMEIFEVDLDGRQLLLLSPAPAVLAPHH
ncbi:hypothetical protein WN944_017597 [Citrus x changshan-huyou]|uniref:Uncharacterized protein n=1 Tax=Citrus x changshan-huyou TaxID=2935761 RepID=A0AAP0QT50_9ROSI